MSRQAIYGQQFPVLTLVVAFGSIEITRLLIFLFDLISLFIVF